MSQGARGRFTAISDVIFMNRNHPRPVPPGLRWGGPVEHMVGTWEIRYPDARGVYDVSEPPEILALESSGFYTWSEPGPPEVALEGRWGVAVERRGIYKLCFDGRDGEPIAHYLVRSPDGEVFHWQRRHHDGVIMGDRVLRGRRVD